MAPSANWHRTIDNQAFGEGEKLVFSIRYLGIRAGRCTLEIPEVLDLGYAQAYKLVASARTSSFFDGVYRVRSEFQSIIDTEGLFSWGFIENQDEKGKLRKRVSRYDHISGTATVTRYPTVKRKNREEVADKPPTVETETIPPFIQDVLSGLYYLRTQQLEVGQIWKMPTISGTKNYELQIEVVGRDETKTPAGTFRTLELIPEVKYDGLFVNKGKMHVFVTDDDKKMPVLLKSKVAVGSFKAVLLEIHRPDTTVVGVDEDEPESGD